MTEQIPAREAVIMALMAAELAWINDTSSDRTSLLEHVVDTVIIPLCTRLVDEMEKEAEDRQ